MEKDLFVEFHLTLDNDYCIHLIILLPWGLGCWALKSPPFVYVHVIVFVDVCSRFRFVTQCWLSPTVLGHIRGGWLRASRWMPREKNLTVMWDFGHSQYDISLLTSFAEKIDMPFFWTRCCREVDINQHLLATAEAPTLGSNIPMPQVPRRASLGNILPCLGSSRFCRVFPAFISGAKNRRETWTE